MMNEKLELQASCFQNLKKLCINFGKDSKERKTEQYLKLRLQALQEQWDEFDTRHKELEQEIEDKNIEYFTDEVYTRLKKMCDDTTEKILKLLKTFTRQLSFDFDEIPEEEGEPPKNDETQKSDRVSTMLSKQRCNFMALERVISKINIKDIEEKWELEDHLTTLRSKWDTIDKQHWELEAILQGSNVQYSVAFVDIENKYEEMKKGLNTKVWSTMHYQRSAPRIEIPEFSGSYMQWISFKDLFLEAVHNNPTINKAQKMQHLKTKLRGEAERLVQHLTISAENYNSCWEILSQRYDNRRLQFTSFVNTMLNLPTIQHPDNYNIKKMHDVITECMNGLANIAVDTHAWDPLLVHLIAQKLDASTFNEYMKEIQDHRDLPKLNEFLYFLESKFMTYEAMKNSKKEVTNAKQPFTTKPNFKTTSSFPGKKFNYDFKKVPAKSFHTLYGQCPFCDGDHVLMQCTKFIDMDSTQRNATVAKLRLCKNCLYSHGNKECNSNKNCKECNLKHHTLLHSTAKKTIPTQSTVKSNSNQRPSTSTNQHSSNHLSTMDLEILLTTIQLQVQTKDGTYVTLRALLDQGSQVNLITENAAQLLRLPRSKLNATVTGIGAVSGDCKGRLQLKCKSIHSDYTFETEALIMKKLTNNLPNRTFDKKDWPHLENLKLADPDYNISRPVDALLGADIYSEIILAGVLRGSLQSPIAQQTHLGWILCGKLQTFNCHVTMIDLSELTKYWESEDITQNNLDTPRNDLCEENYVKTTKRDEDGRYIVKMPIEVEAEKKLGKSKAIAVSQFLQLEKRLERNEKLKSMYRDFIREYIDLQHMKPAISLSNTALQCYLPHHGVLREQSTTTKLRVVFNASQKTTSGQSLNSVLEKGPNLQKDIQNLIIKWRTYKFAFTADIEKMYRCIWVSEDHQPMQKIIWRESPNDLLQEYQLCTVTYGTKSAPWLAMRTLQQLANDDGYKYPAAAEALKNEFYVDDLISGKNSLDDAIELQTSLIKLLKGGGMNLRKWSANNPALLEQLTTDQISTTNIFDFKQDESMKTLGLGWNPKEDTFLFNWNFEEKPQTRLTKRQLLSQISKLYDPLGWLAPITISAKLQFQTVWMDKLGWDEPVSKEVEYEWMKLRDDLSAVKNIKINRWVGGNQPCIELLGYCDASKAAYACVIYCKVTNENGSPTTTLLAAKTRVAPISQKTTLPRLELSGALLLSQLVEKVKTALAGFNITVKAWSDSQVVLAWLQGDSTRWERYVANRVKKIKEVIPADNWQYIKSEHNPADCASRGMLPSKLCNFKLWWQGPALLQENECQENRFKTTLETNKPVMATLATTQTENFINKLLHECSSLTRIVRIVAWTIRFRTNALNKLKYKTTYLTTGELLAATKHIIKFIQQTDFAEEYTLLSNNKAVSNKSCILKLSPYLDEEGIMRVGGRLNKSTLPAGMRNPIIVPKKGRFTELLIQQTHLVTLHGGARLTLAYIRQRYWIVGGNRVVKTQLRYCVRCHRYKPNNNHQLMGDLPEQRINPSRPFTHTGVDFTGHVEVKLNKGRGVKTSKAYIVIFVCMVTKAVHIELTSDMSTETFLAAFQRMCARRGTPKHMYSDCGTNFIGAAKMLRSEFEAFQQALSPVFFNEISKMEVEWHFNAPAWPSAGGLWEAAVRSMKYHLHRVLGDQKLTFEEFTTLLAKIEACMNSRPLCSLTEDPEEFYNYLTPGHFLTGSPTMSLPLSDYSDEKSIDLRRRWQLTEHMLHHFWKTWSEDYLTQLQVRCKWNKASENLKEGDVVLMKDNNLPPGKWAMGRVQQVHPGSDGHVRVATIKTQHGTYKRPVVKLSPLPQPPIETKTEDPGTIKETKQQRKCRKTPQKKTLSTLFMTAIAMFTFITGSLCHDINNSTQITEFERERPIYYDTVGKIQLVHDEWTLLLFYNLTEYWEGIQSIGSYLDGIKIFCERTDPRYCRTTFEQLQHELDILNYYNSILLAPHKHLSERKKRGLVDGIGYIANSLFGILDERFAEKYEQDISTVKTNEKYLLELLKNQTSIVELENNALQKSEDNIKRQCKLLDEYMNQTNYKFIEIEEVMEVLMATNYFNSASLAAYLLINNLKGMQELLFNTLTNVYKGHIDVHLLTPVTLIKEINNIAGKLPRTLSLPVQNIREDIKNMYKLLYVKARITDTYFLFEVHIPLISDEDFSLNRLIPLPIKSGQAVNTVQLTSNYLATNFRKNTYIPIHAEDLSSCIELKKHNLICYKNLPVFNINSENAPCEAKLLSHHSTSTCDVTKSICKDAWIELHATNTWLAICCDTCTVRAICENDITSHTLTASGIVTLAQGCVLQSKDFTIFSHNQYTSNVKMNLDLKIPALNTTVNKMVNMNYQPSFHTSLLEPTETDEIKNKLLSLKEKEQLPSTLTVHDVHQYVICYVILAAAVIVAIYWLAKKAKSHRCCSRSPKGKQRDGTQPSANEDMEMQEIGQPAQVKKEKPVYAKPSKRTLTNHPRWMMKPGGDNISFDFND